MKRFFKKILLMLLLIAVCFSALTVLDYCIIGPQYSTNYQTSLLDKMARLTGIDESKIILVGNSNLAFGIDSELIQEEIGMPVVNLGLHGGLDNAFHEQIAKLNICAGDLVVVCHTTFSDDDKIDNTSLAWITYDCNYPVLSVMRLKDILTMLPTYPNYLKSSLKLWISGNGNPPGSGCYSRSGFNEYGDIADKSEDGQQDVDLLFSLAPVEVPEINSTCTGRLNRLNDYCLERGATLLVAAYPIAYGKYSEFDEDDFIEFQTNLTEALDCPVISDYTDYFYPYDYFYDSVYHLTNEATQIRTRQLISDLNAWLSGNGQNE